MGRMCIGILEMSMGLMGCLKMTMASACRDLRRGRGRRVKLVGRAGRLIDYNVLIFDELYDLYMIPAFDADWRWTGRRSLFM